METSTVTPPCPQCGYHTNNNLPIIPSDTPRFAELLRTNECPTEQEESTFRSFIADGQSSLDTIDTRIALIKLLLAKLEKNKETLSLAITRHKEPLNPIRRTPADVLRQIFLHGAGHDRSARECRRATPHALDLESPPWVFGRVCRRWKDITVYEMPSLWTRVKLKLRKIKSKDLHHQLALLSLLSIYLNRSKALPLTVFLDMSVPKSSSVSFRTSEHASVLNILLAHSRRWVSLFLVGGRAIDMLAISEDSFISLEEVHIQDDSSGDSRSFDIQASELRSWTSVGTTSSPFIRVMPPTSVSHQITEYSVSNVTYIEVLKVIRLFPHLRQLSVQNLSPGNELPGPQLPAIRLSQLQDLRLIQLNLSASSTNAFIALLDVIVCPALTHLLVDACGNISGAIQRLKERSNFELQYLIAAEDADVFVKGLSNCLELEEIEIRGAYLYKSINEVLAHLSTIVIPTKLNNPSQLPPLPNLRRLHFQLGVLPFVDVVVENLHACVISRLFCAQHTTGLRQLEICITTPDAQARKILDSPRLKYLHSVGVKIEIIGL
ncbi:hypothetical protein F5876DRAFT_77971 [Lentinula aff. lateritia]|uniref:Uncharacterized protein n=1 Tax=Lentinula aff. lateritia TaxID=2804960 RepID=A0ACC1TX00_9AGAR|nr:hypothetical protein F5876DRAFT_77971 [Lentinula aff. lateritia]